MNRIFLLLASLFLLLSSYAQHYQNTWESLDARPIPTWFEDAKFGIFLHWGIYSVPAWRKVETGRYASYAEWYYARVMDNKENGGYAFHRKNYGDNFEYRDFAPLFKAELFDPEKWTELFRKSGAKYVVLTAKHHDGYCLWPTKNVHKKSWNSGDTGPHRDLMGDLANAVKHAGLRMGIYYSIPDWESIPRKIDKSQYYIRKEFVYKYGLEPEVYRDEILIPQLKELVIKYEPSLIFSDAGEWLYDDEFWKTKDFLSWLYNDPGRNKEIVVNDRWCKGMPGKHGDYFSSEYKDADADSFAKPWEESRGIGGSYGFNRAENAEDYSTSKDLIVELIDIVSRGGNLLLNVGPTADGRIPVVMQERLLDIGDWLNINGEAIYGTRTYAASSIINNRQDLYFSTKGNKIYCFFTNWTDNIEINLSPNDEIKNVSLLGYDGKINWKIVNENKIIVAIPHLTIDKIPCLYAWTLKIILKEHVN